MKTGTGTVIIVVEDVNDNHPIIPPGEKVVCENEGDSVVIVAEDADQSPFGAPFIFSLPADSDGKWSVTRFNGRWESRLSGVTAKARNIYESTCPPATVIQRPSQLH